MKHVKLFEFWLKINLLYKITYKFFTILNFSLFQSLSYWRSSPSEQLKNIKEDHNDIKVEHHSAKNGISIPECDIAVGNSCVTVLEDEHRINDKKEGIENEAKAAPDSVHHCISNPEPAEQQEGEHSKVNDVGQSNKGIDWRRCSHCVDCKSYGYQSSNKASHYNCLRVILSRNSSNHYRHRTSKKEKKHSIQRVCLSEATYKHEQSDDVNSKGWPI